MTNLKNILVTGGAGYIGCVLVPKLLKENYSVRVLDLFIYGENVFDEIDNRSNLTLIKGDIRDQALLRQSLIDCDAVIHLACISNDPTFELNPELSRSINFEAFEPLVRLSKESGVKRFIYASTCSVYGVSDAENVTEDHPLIPITDYNKYKGLCEPQLLNYQSPDFTTVIIRPATTCGYSPRQRFDLTVNILTNHAYNANRITVYGGQQTRPNIHIEDITDLYCMMLHLPKEQIAGKIFNAGYQNHSIAELAAIVRHEVMQQCPDKHELEIEMLPSDDPRSYRICSEKIRRELNFVPQRTVSDAARDLIEAFRAGKLPDAMNDIRYYNIRTMKTIKLR